MPSKFDQNVVKVFIQIHEAEYSVEEKVEEEVF